MTADSKTPDLAAVVARVRDYCEHLCRFPEMRADLEAICAAAERAIQQDVLLAASARTARLCMHCEMPLVTIDIGLEQRLEKAQSDLAALRAELVAARRQCIGAPGIVAPELILERDSYGYEALRAELRQLKALHGEQGRMELQAELANMRAVAESLNAERAERITANARLIDAALAERDEAREELAALRKRLAMAEADARRLDWLERHHASIWWGGILERRKGHDPDAVALEWLDAGALVEQSERFDTLRDAVDAALAARNPGAADEGK